jgi:hypothetical protein
MHRERHPRSVLGPFYVEAGCCVACGIPEATAPELFSRDSESHCFVKRQPANEHEVDRMLLTMIRSEVGCIRYAGTDERVTRRLAEQGERILSDIPPPPDAVRIHLDHVALRNLPQAANADGLMDAFIAYLQRQPMPERYRFDVRLRSHELCELKVAWFKENFHPITFQRLSDREFDGLIIGLEYQVYEWLAEERLGTPTFFENTDWHGSRSSGRSLPW